MFLELIFILLLTIDDIRNHRKYDRALLLDYTSKISRGLYKQAQQQLLEDMAFSDELLRCFASVLRKAFPNALSCARMGGDEFTVILPAMHEARRNAAFLHLYKLMDEQNKKNPTLRLSTAIGYVCRSEFGKEVDIRMLYQEADERMYQNKKEMKEKQPELFRR